MYGHFIKVNMCISSVLCQSCYITIKRVGEERWESWQATLKNELQGHKQQIDSKYLKQDIKKYIRINTTNLRQYISSNESLSSTIGIELTWAAKAKDKLCKYNYPM